MKKSLYFIGASALLLASGAQAASVGMVKEAQVRLNALGYQAGKTDGVVGDQTRSALVSFQRRNGLAISGTVDGDTYALLQDSEYRYGSAYNDYSAYSQRSRVAYGYGYAPYRYSQGANYYRGNWGQPVAANTYYGYNYNRNADAVPVRFGRLDVVANGGATGSNYTVTLNGQPVLYANNQPQPIGISKVQQLSGEDAVIFTAYDGSGGCCYKNYLFTVKSDGTYTPAQQVGNCTGRYQAKVDGNMLFISFPSDYADSRRDDVWRYGNSTLARL